MVSETGGNVVVLGFFDGVHIGHQALLSAAREMADGIGCPVAVRTFETLPGREYLTPPPLREKWLKRFGADAVIADSFSGLKDLDPESFVLSKRFDILGTYEAYKKFHVEEDGIPKTEDLLWTIVSTYTDWKVELTSSIDMELSVREANTKRGSGQKETLPAGTHFVLLKTDGEAYAEAMLDGGRICEFELEHPSEEEWEGRINGVSISDCFEYVPYAG